MPEASLSASVYVAAAVFAVLILGFATAVYCLFCGGRSGVEEEEEAEAMAAEEEAAQDAEIGQSESASAVRQTESEGQASRDDPVNLERLLKLLAKRATMKVGPKLFKAHQLQSQVRSQFSTTATNVGRFVWEEALAALAAVLAEAGAEEYMVLFDSHASAEMNIPTASILIAGALSPVVLNFAYAIHVFEVCVVLVPIFLLCMWATYTDWTTLPVCAVPTIRSWLFMVSTLSSILILAHGAAAVEISRGKRKIAQKLAGMKERLASTFQDEDEIHMEDVREFFIIVSIDLEHSLVVERAIRRSVWRNVVGVLTMLWMATVLWTFILTVGWTFAPGIIVFHPDIKVTPGDPVCMAHHTIFTVRLVCVLSVMFLVVNMLTTTQYICDQVIISKPLATAMLAKARQWDRRTLGVPVVEAFCRAFFLRGSLETIQAQLEASKCETAKLEWEREKLTEEIGDVSHRILMLQTEVEVLKRETGASTEERLADAAAAEARQKDPFSTESCRAKAMEKATEEEIHKIYSQMLEAASVFKQQGITALVSAGERAEESMAMTATVSEIPGVASASSSLARRGAPTQGEAPSASSSFSNLGHATVPTPPKPPDES